MFVDIKDLSQSKVFLIGQCYWCIYPSELSWQHTHLYHVTLLWSSVLFWGQPDFRRYGFIYIVHMPYYTSGSNSPYKHQPYKAELPPIQITAGWTAESLPLCLTAERLYVWWLPGTYSPLSQHHRVCHTSSFALWRQAGTNQECLSQTANTLSHHGIHFLVLLILPNWVARGAWSITEYLLCNFWVLTKPSLLF